MPKRILIVDDEPLIVKGLKYSLEQDGYETESAQDGEEAVSKFFAGQYDLVLLDVMLPKLDGIEVCQRIREKSNVPIIMLTAKGDDMDKILGLEYGADDYMTKPFNILEVKARIKTIFRRSAMMQKENVQRIVTVRDMTGEPEQPHASPSADREVNLTAKEFDLLQLFVTNRGKVFSPGDAAGNHLEIRLSGRSAHGGRAHPPTAGEDRTRFPASPNTSSPSGEWATISLTRIKNSYPLHSVEDIDRLPADHRRGLYCGGRLADSAGGRLSVQSAA